MRNTEVPKKKNIEVLREKNTEVPKKNTRRDKDNHIDIEEDIVIKLPPIKKYRVKLIINKVRKAKPRIIIDDILIDLNDSIFTP